jgi:hypothetical protein
MRQQKNKRQRQKRRADDSALEIREVASQPFGTNVESNVVASDAASQEKAPTVAE